MALVRNNLSLRMKGRAGSFSFYSSKGRQVARVAQNSSNYGESARRSEAQQVRRVKWANLVNVYKLMAGTLHGAFETKRSNETDYNAFMRKNLSLASVALTKDQAAMGCCVPQSFIVSEGSLVGVNLTNSDGFWLTNIKIPENTEIGVLTVAAFTSMVLGLNAWAREGMQFSILILNPGEPSDTPKASFSRHELTLDTMDTSLMSSREVWDSGVASEGGFLQFMQLSTDAYIAFVVSDSTSGQLKVSNARFVAGDTELETTFSSEEQTALSIKSYGVDATRFLDSGDM